MQVALSAAGCHTTPIVVLLNFPQLGEPVEDADLHKGWVQSATGEGVMLRLGKWRLRGLRGFKLEIKTFDSLILSPTDLELAGMHAIVALDEGVSKVVQRELRELVQSCVVEVLVEGVPQVVLRPMLELPLERGQDDLASLIALLRKVVVAPVRGQQLHRAIRA